VGKVEAGTSGRYEPVEPYPPEPVQSLTIVNGVTTATEAAFNGAAVSLSMWVRRVRVFRNESNATTSRMMKSIRFNGVVPTSG
jgi:hypothetical protein